MRVIRTAVAGVATRTDCAMLPPQSDGADMDQTKRLIPSKFVDVFDKELGFPIEESSTEEFNNLSDQECLDLAARLDTQLQKELRSIKPSPTAVAPLPFDVELTAGIDSSGAVGPLALLQPQVVLPIVNLEEAIWYPPEHSKRKRGEVNKKGLMMVHEWARENAKLLRKGVILPRSYEVYLSNSVDRLCTRAAYGIDFSRVWKRVTEFAPVIPIESKRESINILRMTTYYLFQEMFVARKLNARAAISDIQTYKLWKYLEHSLLVSAANEVCKVSTTLLRLELPDINGISKEDLVRLHGDSEAFASWRYQLASTLRNIERRLEAGEHIQTVADEEMLPLKERARAIEKELSNTSIRQKLKTAATTVAIGAATLAATHPVLDYLGLPTATLRDLVKLGPAAAVSLLWWLFFDKPKGDKEIIARCYNALLGRSP